jgi:hypothetical protein
MGGSMSAANGASSPKGKKWGWWLKLVLSLIGPPLAVFIVQYMRIGGPKVLASVDFGHWAPPRCVEEQLKVSSSKSKRPNLGEAPYKLLDAKGMYHIVINNKGSEAEGAEVEIPHAYYIEIIRNGEEPNCHWRLQNNKDFFWYTLGKIECKHPIEINAWTTDTPNRKMASIINITHKYGSVSPYVNTPVPDPAAWVSNNIAWSIVAAVILLILYPLAIYYSTLCRRLCGRK